MKRFLILLSLVLTSLQAQAGLEFFGCRSADSSIELHFPMSDLSGGSLIKVDGKIENLTLRTIEGGLEVSIYTSKSFIATGTLEGRMALFEKGPTGSFSIFLETLHCGGSFATPVWAQ